MDHLATVKRAAKKYARKSFGRTPYEDYLSAGYLGLVLAVRTFDPTRGFKFLTIAYHYINGALMEVGETNRRQSGWNHTPRKAELAAGVPKRMIQRVSFVQWPTMRTEDGEEQPIDVASQETAADRIEEIHRAELRAKIIGTATNSCESLIFNRRLDGCSFSEIGEELGVTHQRVRQIFDIAVQRAKNILSIQGQR